MCIIKHCKYDPVPYRRKIFEWFIENFVCSKTNMFANAKILEESNPCELIALKCRMDYFLYVQYSIISLINIFIFWSSGKTLLFKKERSTLVKEGKTLLAISFSLIVSYYLFFTIPECLLYHLIFFISLFKVSLVSAVLKTFHKLWQQKLGTVFSSEKSQSSALPQQLI